jgi:hypothetical protein
MKRRWASTLAICLSLVAAPQQAAAAGLRFVDATESAGLPVARGTSWGSTIADINGDGWADVLLNRHTQPPAMYTGGPAGFSELALPWPAPVDRTTAPGARRTATADRTCSARRGRSAAPAMDRTSCGSTCPTVSSSRLTRTA